MGGLLVHPAAGGVGVFCGRRRIEIGGDGWRRGMVAVLGAGVIGGNAGLEMKARMEGTRQGRRLGLVAVDNGWIVGG